MFHENSYLLKIYTHEGPKILSEFETLLILTHVTDNIIYTPICSSCDLLHQY